MEQSWIEQWGPYLIGLAGLLAGVVTTVVSIRSNRSQAVEARSHEARMERARFMRSTLAEAQLAFAGGNDKLLPIAILAGKVDTAVVEDLVAKAMQASLRLRELAAMTNDPRAADLLRELVERLHVQTMVLARAANLTRIGQEQSGADSPEVLARLSEGNPEGEGLRPLPVMDIWEELRSICSREFEQLAGT